VLGTLLLALVLNGIECYSRGEIVSFAKRSKVGAITTEWSDAIVQHRPRYLLDRVVSLNTVDLTNEELSSDFKLQFSFDRGQFITPWITLSDGNKRVSEVKISFWYSEEGEIKQFKSKVTYVEAAQGVEPSIKVRFEWNFFGEEDFTAGLGFLCLFPLIAGMLLLIFIFVDSQFLTTTVLPGYINNDSLGSMMHTPMDMMSDSSLYSQGFMGSEYSQHEHQHKQHGNEDENRHKHKAKNI
jgi:hypothetical protein